MNEELKFLRKFTKKNFGEGGGGYGRCSGWGGQGGCEVFVKIQKKKLGGVWGGGSDGGVGLLGCQGECERRIEVFVEI